MKNRILHVEDHTSARVQRHALGLLAQGFQRQPAYSR
jgi:hypothetical protein